jgi:GNAT superfamily N-acetyltransferase
MQPSIPIPDGLNIRPARQQDKGFLERLYNSTREDLRLLDAQPDFIEALIDMQFQAQQDDYGERFPNAMHFIIEKHTEAIGRATLNFSEREIRIVDIAFLPEARGNGFGQAIIQSFQICAEQSAVPLALTVSNINQMAIQVYLKLGFQIDSQDQLHTGMCWYPQILTKVGVGS